LHVHSGGEFGEVAEKRGSEIDGVGIVGAEGGMFLAERGGVWSYGEAALVTVGEAKGTAGGIFVERLGFLCAGLSGCELSGLGVRPFLVNGGVSGRGAKRFEFHFGPRFLKWLIPPLPP